MYFKTLADAENFLLTTSQVKLNDIIDCIALFPNSLSILFAAHRFLKTLSLSATDIYLNWAAEKNTIYEKSGPFLEGISHFSQRLSEVEAATTEDLENYTAFFNNQLEIIQEKTKSFSSIVPAKTFESIDEAIKAFEKLKLQLLEQKILASPSIIELTPTAIQRALKMDVETLCSLLSKTNSKMHLTKDLYLVNFKTLLEKANIREYFATKLADDKIITILFGLAKASENLEEVKKNTEAVIRLTLPSLNIENILFVLKDIETPPTLKDELFAQLTKQVLALQEVRLRNFSDEAQKVFTPPPSKKVDAATTPLFPGATAPTRQFPPLKVSHTITDGATQTTPSLQTNSVEGVPANVTQRLATPATAPARTALLASIGAGTTLKKVTQTDSRTSQPPPAQPTVTQTDSRTPQPPPAQPTKAAPPKTQFSGSLLSELCARLQRNKQKQSRNQAGTTITTTTTTGITPQQQPTTTVTPQLRRNVRNQAATTTTTTTTTSITPQPQQPTTAVTPQQEQPQQQPAKAVPPQPEGQAALLASIRARTPLRKTSPLRETPPIQKQTQQAQDGPKILFRLNDVGQCESELNRIKNIQDKSSQVNQACNLQAAVKRILTRTEVEGSPGSGGWEDEKSEEERLQSMLKELEKITSVPIATATATTASPMPPHIPLKP
ncbi:MAG: hypothetical protein K0S08_1001 [Gammaproteobacteria bacterium]|jgi:hypothetical protein|nr:hypothetical protein [Gammaproteobacteria bacterium]